MRKPSCRRDIRLGVFICKPVEIAVSVTVPCRAAPASPVRVNTEKNGDRHPSQESGECKVFAFSHGPGWQIRMCAPLF